jgi:hypothetical protein
MSGVMGGRRKRTTSRIEAPALSRKGPVNRYSPRLLAPRRLSTRLPAPGTANARPATVFFSLMGAEGRPTVRGAGPMTDAEAFSLRRAWPQP